jgi:peptidoglycan/LPS O-acetylase OafA/YrhL
MEINDKARNIPSLDGLRAVSIFLVILAHSCEHFAAWSRIPIRTYLLFAHTGVSVFFVVSGFLITRLLLKELHTTGAIRLARFYLRRSFRIFPAFYFYLGIIFVLTLSGLFDTPLRAFFFSAIYASNYYIGPGGGFVGLQHFWSLSVEEHFYLLWPAALIFLGKRKAIYLSIFLIFISPFLRVATYLILAPQNRALVNRMSHSSSDTIMFGCLLALLWDSRSFGRWLRIGSNPWAAAFAASFLCFIDPLLDLRFFGRYDLTIGMTLEGLCICVITIFVIRRPTTLPGKTLNSAVLRHIGVISYSLYLWQNIFTGNTSQYFPFNLLAVLACAELSYLFVERPSLAVRDKLDKKSAGALALS